MSIQAKWHAEIFNLHLVHAEFCHTWCTMKAVEADKLFFPVIIGVYQKIDLA